MKAYSSISESGKSVWKSQYKLIQSETQELAAASFQPVLHLKISEGTHEACYLCFLTVP